jgi:uncharacterized protein (DUF305 family)
VKRPIVRGLAAAGFAAALLSACASEKPAQTPATAAVDHSKMPGMGAMSLPVNIPKGAIYTEADVRFMQGMIAHHGQAIYMSRLAKSRGASPRLLKFATKIDQSQIAEIILMQDWLRANGQAVPDSASYHHTQMPGMLTTEQLARLTTANGADFERAFLELMIQHHMGALKMVDDLHAAPLSAQDVDVSVFANDVVTVQTAEIEAMQQMLSDL